MYVFVLAKVDLPIITSKFKRHVFVWVRIWRYRIQLDSCSPRLSMVNFYEIAPASQVKTFSVCSPVRYLLFYFDRPVLLTYSQSVRPIRQVS